MKKNAHAKGIETILRRKRSSLMLLHPTSLPDPEGAAYGVGELGSEAFRFVDFLKSAGALAWQTLPLGHTGYGDSPYQTFSRFAGSPYLISVEKLREAGDLSREDHDDYVARARQSGPPAHRTDFGWLFHHKLGAGWNHAPGILRRAFETFEKRPAKDARRTAFEAFCQHHASAYSGWLNDYADYMALKEHNDQKCWADWPDEFREAKAWREARGWMLEQDSVLGKTVRFYQYLQFVFFEQWDALRAYARERGRLFVGDIPWYVGYDSADVWAHREAFELDGKGVPLFVAGVPPDYFSATGQLWGNPLYDWSKPSTLDWWVDGLSFLLSKVDVLRLDHFRAADTYWKIPWDWAATRHTAENGCWAKAPGRALFEALRKRIESEGRGLPGGQLPIIAEDLGFLDPLFATPESYPADWNPSQRFQLEASFQALLESEQAKAMEAKHRAAEKQSPEVSGKSSGVPPAEHSALGPAFNPDTGEYNTRKGVDLLLDEFHLPRMEVLQFGLEGAGPDYPARVGRECVLYTGTHDNETALGWYRAHAAHRIQEAVANDRTPFQVQDPLGQPIELGIVTLLRDAAWEMIEMVLGSNASAAAVPLQDILGLGSEARMNTPGDQAGGWWAWRAAREQVDYEKAAARLKKWNEMTGRLS